MPPPPQHRAGPACTSWHDPQGPRAARMGLTGKQLDQVAFGSLGRIIGGKERTLEHPLDSNMRAQGTGLRKQHIGGVVWNPRFFPASVGSSVLVWGKELRPRQLDNWRKQRLQVNNSFQLKGRPEEEEPAREVELAPSL